MKLYRLWDERLNLLPYLTFYFMKISNSIIPSIVFYTSYTDCTIQQALLHALQHSKDNILRLDEVWNIKVNGSRIIGSYWKAFENLNKMWYRIKNTTKFINNRLHSWYHLENPTYNPE